MYEQFTTLRLFEVGVFVTERGDEINREATISFVEADFTEADIEMLSDETGYLEAYEEVTYHYHRIGYASTLDACGALLTTYFGCPTGDAWAHAKKVLDIYYELPEHIDQNHTKLSAMEILELNVIRGYSVSQSPVSSSDMLTPPERYNNLSRLLQQTSFNEAPEQDPAERLRNIWREFRRELGL